MDDHGAILCQISSYKYMLDQVNEEIEARIEVSREIDSEIEKCKDVEIVLSARESELTKIVYMLNFDIRGLVTVAADSKTSVKRLEEELCHLQMRHDEILKKVDDCRKGFTTSCLDFQTNLEMGRRDIFDDLLSEKQSLENEFLMLNKKRNALQNSMSAFVEEILEDLRCSNSALEVEVESRKIENAKLLKDIDELKRTLLSAISME